METKVLAAIVTLKEVLERDAEAWESTTCDALTTVVTELNSLLEQLQERTQLLSNANMLLAGILRQRNRSIRLPKSILDELDIKDVISVSQDSLGGVVATYRPHKPPSRLILPKGSVL